MLGLIFIYFIGRHFYDMAKKYNQSGWLYGILGALSYYAGIIIGSLILGIVLGSFYPNLFDEIPDTVFGLMMIPIGVLTCWGFYQILKKKWHKEFLIKDSLDWGGLFKDPEIYFPILGFISIFIVGIFIKRKFFQYA